MSHNTLFLEIGLESIKLLVLQQPESIVIDFENIFFEGLGAFKTSERLEHYHKSIKMYLSRQKLEIAQVKMVLKDPQIEINCIPTQYTAYLSILEALREKLWETHKVSDSDYEIFISPGQKISLNRQTFTQATTVPKSIFLEYKAFLSKFNVKSCHIYSMTQTLAWIEPKLTKNATPNSNFLKLTIFVSHAQTMLCLSCNNQSLKCRTIPIGTANFSKVLLGDIIYEGITFTTTLEEAEQIKQVQGVCHENLTPTSEANLVKLPPSVTQELFAPILENLKLELKRFISAALTEFNLSKIDSMVLLGSGAKIKNLDRFFQTESSIPCHIFDSDFHVSPEKQTKWHDLSHEFSHFCALKTDINMTDLLSPTRPFTLFRLKLEKYALAITFALLIVLYLCLEFHAQKMQQQLLQLTDQWNERVKSYVHYFHYQNEKKRSLESLVKISAYQAMKIPWIGFFKQLSQVDTPHIMLEELRLETAETFSLYPTYFMVLKGSVSILPSEELTHEGVIGEYMKTLNASAWLKSVILSYIHASGASPGDTQTTKLFELKAEFKFNHE